MEYFLMHNLATIGAVPSQAIYISSSPRISIPFESAGRFCSTTIPTVSAYRIGEWGTLPGSKNISPSHTSEQSLKWRTLIDMNVLVFPIVYHLEQHVSLVLIEVFRR